MAKRAAALPGTLAVSYLLAGSRWASQIGAAPLYVTDVLVGLAIFHAAYRRHLGGSTARTGSSARSRPGLPLAAFLAWVAFRAITTPVMSVNYLRDLAPYAYAAIAFLSARGYSRSTPAQRVRTLRVLHGALVFHLAWVAIASLAPSAVAGLPAFGNAALFQLRPDVDATLVGVLAAFILWRILSRTAHKRDRLILLASGIVLADLSSRAGFVAALAALALVLWAGIGLGSRRRRAWNIAVLIFAGGMLVAALPFTETGTRLLATVAPGSADSEIAQTAVGTADARSNAWAKLTDYVAASPSRQAVGVGFGPDFLHDSGADVALLGQPDPTVRSPHNFLLGTYARLGIIGVALWLALAIQALRVIRRSAPQFRENHLLVLSSLLVVALIPAGLLGVVLESPFGAIPFYWAAGIMLSRPRTQIAAPPAVVRPARLHSS